MRKKAKIIKKCIWKRKKQMVGERMARKGRKRTREGHKHLSKQHERQGSCFLMKKKPIHLYLFTLFLIYIWGRGRSQILQY